MFIHAKASKEEMALVHHEDFGLLTNKRIGMMLEINWSIDQKIKSVLESSIQPSLRCRLGKTINSLFSNVRCET